VPLKSNRGVRDRREASKKWILGEGGKGWFLITKGNTITGLKETMVYFIRPIKGETRL
jgi:hypothetical protein